MTMIANDEQPPSWLVSDRLTGLAQRDDFVRQLAALLESRSRPDRVALCCLDLDRFEAVNDGLGWSVGDELLVEAAGRLNRLAGRAGRVVARLDSDKFAILLPGTAGPTEAENLAVRALGLLAEPFRLDGRVIHLTASAGVVERSTAGAAAPELLGAAVSAMHWAKADGRDRYRVYSKGRDVAESSKLDLSATMPAAIDAGEFELHYQPLVDLRHGERIIGFEALARWRHPRRGLIGPNHFLGLAQERGLMTALGTSLLRSACQEAATWFEIGGSKPYVSVNVAADQLADPGFVDVVRGALADAALPADRLQLEIVEHAEIETDERLQASLRKLDTQGVRLTIDDFGTGYSNLNLLPRLPLRGLKLDCGFIAGLADASQRPFMRNVVSIAKTLKLTVTAEGVETPRQAADMRGLGCRVGQGWLFGPPMPAENVNPTIREARNSRRVPNHAAVSRARRYSRRLELLLRGA